MQIKSFSLITCNIICFRKLKDPIKLQRFHDIITKYSPDILLLQEDIKHPAPNYPPAYIKITCSLTNEGITNTILVHETQYEKILPGHSYQLISSSHIQVSRAASSVYYDGASICNLHLSGGREDDVEFINITDLRDLQVTKLMGYDIVAGDFNSNPDDSRFPSDHPVYLSASPGGREIFKRYFKSGHKPLSDAGMVRVTLDKPTDAFGGNPDHVYYNPVKLTPVHTEVIDLITQDLSDHNAVFVRFQLR